MDTKAMIEEQGEALPIHGDDAKTALEQRYMRALEARVAQLEALVQTQQPSRAISNGVSDPWNLDKVPHDSVMDPFSPLPPFIEDRRASVAVSEDQGSHKPDGPKLDSQGLPTIDENADLSRARVQHVIGQYSPYTLKFEELLGAKGTESGAHNQKFETKNRTIFRKVMTETTPRRILCEEIEIDSIELRNLFTTISRNKPWPSAEHGPLQLKSPFAEFVWFWDEFKSACKPVAHDSSEVSSAREDLTELLKLLERSQLEPYFKIRESSLASGTMPYEYLWTLFPTGTKVYTRSFLGELQMLEVRTCDYPLYSSVPSSSYSYPYSSTLSKNQPEWIDATMTVTCGGFDWDGTRFTAFTYPLSIQRDYKQTAMTIDSLAAFPTKYYRDEDGEKNDSSLQANLIKSGRRYSEICSREAEKAQYKYHGVMLADLPAHGILSMSKSSQAEEDETKSLYSGPDESASLTKPVTSSTILVNQTEYHGVILTDTEGFIQEQTARRPLDPVYTSPLGFVQGTPLPESSCRCESCKESPLLQWLRSSGNNAKEQHTTFATSEDRLILCPPRVLGYALTSRAWAQVLVKSLKAVAVENDETYFRDQLQLDNELKTMLLDFVKNHEYSGKGKAVKASDPSKVSKSFDIVERKGQGLAILLHGPPGVGKTLTAETIALATGRPLLPISVAEIGTNAAHAEKRLQGIFVNAARWRAVLLIDEADVFLEERVRTDNPNRNALVSVLLRCLEYYEGIIILTTNRIKSIDVAVQSRMHLAVQYKNLTQEQMLEIYKNLLADIPDEKLDEKRNTLLNNVKRELCGRRSGRSQMNGRQIRNIVSTARALAQASDTGRLEFDHLRKVFEFTSEFLEGLKEVNERSKMRNLVDEV